MKNRLKKSTPLHTQTKIPGDRAGGGGGRVRTEAEARVGTHRRRRGSRGHARTPQPPHLRRLHDS